MQNDQELVQLTLRERLALGAIRLAVAVLAVGLLFLLGHRYAAGERGDAPSRTVLWTGSTIQHGWVSATTRDGRLSSLVGVVATPCPDWHWFRIGWPSERWHTRRSGARLSATHDIGLVRDETRQFAARLRPGLTVTIGDNVHGTLSVTAPTVSGEKDSRCQTVTQRFVLRPIRD
jgi:hypothetical protein